MEKKEHIKSEKEVTNDSNHIFSQMEDFIQTHTIQTTKDIVVYFSRLIDFSNQLIEDFFTGEESNELVISTQDTYEYEEKRNPPA
jgi:hypothetical protein